MSAVWRRPSLLAKQFWERTKTGQPDLREFGPRAKGAAKTSGSDQKSRSWPINIPNVTQLPAGAERCQKLIAGNKTAIKCPSGKKEAKMQPASGIWVRLCFCDRQISRANGPRATRTTAVRSSVHHGPAGSQITTGHGPHGPPPGGARAKTGQPTAARVRVDPDC